MSMQSTRAVLIVFTFALFIVNTLIPTNPGLYVLDGIAVLVLLSTFSGISTFNLLLSSLFLILTIVIGWTYHVSWTEIIHGFSYMVKLLLFVSFVPIISMPIKGLIPKLQRFILVISKKVSLKSVCNYTTFMLANLTNLAALPITKSIFTSKKNTEEIEWSYSVIIIRAYGIAMVCSPLGAAVAVVIDIANINFLSLLSVNVVIIVFGLLISVVINARNTAFASFKKEEEELRFQKDDLFFLAKILTPILIYFVVLTLVDGNSNLGMMELIVLSILPLTLCWSIGIRKVKEWWGDLTFLVKEQSPNMFNQFSVIISAGLTIYTVELVGLDYEILSSLPGDESDYAAMIYIPVIIIAIMILAVVGVHQFVALVFVGEMIEPTVLGIHPIIYASTLLVGLVSGLISSSFSGANILMSNLTPPMSSYAISKRNYIFTFIFIGLSVIYLVIMNWIMGE